MANILPVLLSLIVLQSLLKAASSDNNVASTKQIEEGPKLDSVPRGVSVQSTIENESENNQREKRFYDYAGYSYPQPGFPSNFPFPFQPPYSKRDDSQHTGVNGADDTFSLIFKRLQEIVKHTRQNAQFGPQQPTIPAFIPFLYIPQVDCGCSTNSNIPTRPVKDRTQPKPNNTQTTTSKNTTIPDFPNRIGVPSNNETGVSGDTIKPEMDGNRPISFDPVIPETPLDVPVPPVEHGSVQEGAQPQPIPTTTFRSRTTRPTTNRSVNRFPEWPNRVPSIAPSICDTAVISCCSRSQITANCFAQQGCADTSKYGKPCDPTVVLNLINKVQHYIKQRRS